MPEIKNILVIQTAFLGDVVLATGILEKLHTFHPSARIDCMVRKGNEGLLKDHPFLRNVYVFDKEHKLKSLWKSILQIRKARYDVVINLQRFLTSGIITALSGGRVTVGFSKNPLSFFFSQSHPHKIATGIKIHEIERNHSLIQGITDPQPARPALYPTPDDYNKVSGYKAEPYICIAPASIWFTKQYPYEKWVEFINDIKGYTIFLLGAPGDVALCESIKKETVNSKVQVLAGQLNLLASAALMKDAAMNFVNDSAPMHLASAVNAPVTAVYCSTVPEFGFGPLSDKSFIVERQESLYCRPCGLHGYKACPEGHFLCARSIEKNQLLEILDDE